MKFALLPMTFALMACVHADAKQNFFRFVNQHGGGGLNSSAAGIVGGHHGHSVHVKSFKSGFETSYIDTSVDLVVKEFAKIAWSQVDEFVAKPDGYYDAFNLQIKVGPMVRVHRFEQSGSGRNVKHSDSWVAKSTVIIYFPSMQLAEQAANLARKAQFEELQREHGPLYRVVYNGLPLKMQSNAPFRIVDGVAYARVCSLTDAGIKTYNDNFRMVTMTWEGTEWKWPVGEKAIHAGNESFTTKRSPVRLRDNLYYPVRDLVSHLGYTLSWDSRERVLYLARRAPIVPPTL